MGTSGSDLTRWLSLRFRPFREASPYGFYKAGRRKRLYDKPGDFPIPETGLDFVPVDSAHREYRQIWRDLYELVVDLFSRAIVEVHVEQAGGDAFLVFRQQLYCGARGRGAQKGQIDACEERFEEASHAFFVVHYENGSMELVLHA